MFRCFQCKNSTKRKTHRMRITEVDTTEMRTTDFGANRCCASCASSTMLILFIYHFFKQHLHCYCPMVLSVIHPRLYTTREKKEELFYIACGLWTHHSKTCENIFSSARWQNRAICIVYCVHIAASCSHRIFKILLF